MIWFWIFVVIFLALFIFLMYLVLSEISRIVFRGGMPSISSTREIVDKIISERFFPANGLILDLGSGRGRTLRRFWRAGLHGPFLGYEKEFAPWLISTIWNIFTMAPVKTVQGELLDAPIEKAKGIYLFLLPDVLAKIGSDLKTRISHEAVIVSAEFAFPDWEPDHVFEARGVTKKKAKIYIYRKFGDK